MKKHEVSFSDSKHQRVTIEDGAVVVSGRLFMRSQHDDGPVEHQVVVARLFTKHGHKWKDLQGWDARASRVLDDSGEVRRSESRQPPSVGNSDRSLSSEWTRAMSVRCTETT